SLPNHTTAKVMQTLEKLKAKFKFA
ncbi:hypothetical protein RFX65_13130, partial [Acinetobacter baumannii]|nr:hypothetical protein [Acinetobacter baumannii]